MEEGFARELSECPLEDEKKTALQGLQTRSEAVQRELDAANVAAMGVRGRQVISQEIQRLRDEFEAFCAAHMPLADPHDLEREFEGMHARAKARISESFAKYPEVMELKDVRDALLDGEMAARELLMRKVLQNEGVNKDARIAELAQETKQQQALLIEQSKRLEIHVEEERKKTQRTSRPHVGRVEGVSCRVKCSPLIVAHRPLPPVLPHHPAELEARLAEMTTKEDTEHKRQLEIEAILKQRDAEIEQLKKQKKCTIL